MQLGRPRQIKNSDFEEEIEEPVRWDYSNFDSSLDVQNDTKPPKTIMKNPNWENNYAKFLRDNY